VNLGCPTGEFNLPYLKYELSGNNFPYKVVSCKYYKEGCNKKIS
jgi:hypothetical protein